MDVKVKLCIECKNVGRDWVAICPVIDVASQSRTKAGAIAGISEAVGLWFESCISRGVLEQALEDSGFKRSETGEIPEDAVNIVATRSAERPELDESKPIEFRVSKGNAFVEGFIPSIIAGKHKYHWTKPLRGIGG
jgi:predicted RNase H-like HicB family nuclease